MRGVRISLLVLAALSAAAATPRTLIVGERLQYASVQEALRHAAPGDTIRVSAGTYVGNLVLDKAVVIEGVHKPAIRGDGRGSVVTVLAPDCTIRGFVIQRSGGMLVDEDSGILLKSDRNRIEQNLLEDVLYGIYLLNSSGNVVAGNVIRGRGSLEVGERGSGIHIWNSSDNTIAGNAISQMRDGMYFQNAYRTTVSNNRVFELRYGLHYMFSDDNQFQDNLFYDNVAGAAIMYSRRIQFRRNSFLHNRGFSSFGVLFQDSDDLIAEGNVIAGNVVGIFMEALRTSRFSRNLVAANDVAFQIFSSASDNIFRENNFIDNLSPIQVIGKATGTRWSDQGAGNYWSDYDGYDLDGDGVGDVPFRIQNVFEHLEGNYPRLRLYLFSPASQALEIAERTFPIIQSSSEVDPLPLMKPVALALPVPESDTSAAAGLGALAFPLAMLAVSTLIMVRGRRK